MSGFEPKSKDIGGKKFTVAPLPFGKGREGLRRLLAVIAPAIGDALSRGVSVTALLGDARIAGLLGGALSGLPARLDEETMQWFESEFGARSKAQVGDINAELKLDSEANRATVFESLGYMAFFQWLGFCLEVSYGGFFGEVAAALGLRLAAKQSAPTK